ncbi:YjcZ family sporulation protein [Sporosarcina sp. BP05]|uniref:YjcZ family sporulation protein n=1 Tax=Sporosarcina sp. BP05 TaxID=2758726 RepID=UPI001646C8E4|nr:YjcZ family sporulation protein [Sporosarcina sp. BP05]
MFGGCNSFGGGYGGGCGGYGGGCEVERGGSGSTFCLIVVLFILLIIVGRTFCV